MYLNVINIIDSMPHYHIFIYRVGEVHKNLINFCKVSGEHDFVTTLMKESYRKNFLYKPMHTHEQEMLK